MIIPESWNVLLQRREQLGRVVSQNDCIERALIKQLNDARTAKKIASDLIIGIEADLRRLGWTGESSDSHRDEKQGHPVLSVQQLRQQ